MTELLIMLAIPLGVAYIVVAGFHWSEARDTLSRLQRWGDDSYMSPSEEDVAHALWVMRGGAFAWPLTAIQKLREDRAEAEELLRRKR